MWSKYVFFDLKDYFDASAEAVYGGEENLRADIQELMLPVIKAKRELKRKIETHCDTLAELVVDDKSVYEGAKEVIDAMSNDIYERQILEDKLSAFEGCVCHISLAQDLAEKVIEGSGLFDVEIDGEIVNPGLALIIFYKKYEELFGQDFSEMAREYAGQAISAYCDKFRHINVPTIEKK